MNESMNKKAVCRTAWLHRCVKYTYGRHKISWFVRLASLILKRKGKKSHIRETKTLLTNADSSTDTKNMNPKLDTRIFVCLSVRHAQTTPPGF